MKLNHVSWLWRPAALSIALLTVGGCAALGGSAGKKPAAAHREDEEAGVNHITTALREFNRAVESKNFDVAGARLRDAEDSVKHATAITRGHPDFEEIEERVVRARPRLDEAIERDRIERRNAAIADLVRRGDQLVQRGNIILGELTKRVPQAEDMANLKEAIEALTTIEKEGEGFLDDRRYRDHAQTRDKLLSVIIGRRRQAEWQIQASGAVGKTIEEAIDTVNAAKKATTAPEQLLWLRKAADAFAACINAIADAESLGGYEPTSVLTTRMGTLAVSETKKRCIDTSNKVRVQADRLAFRERVGGIVKRVDTAVSALNSASNAADKLTLAEAAIQALAQCQAELDATLRGPAFDTSFTFDTALGAAFNADKLQRTCGSERTRLVTSLPAWRWRKSFEVMKTGLVTIKQRIDEANTPADIGAQLPRWQKVLENLTSCVEKAKSLTQERDADLRYAFVTPFGSLTVEGVGKQCERQRVVAEGKLAQAVEAQSIETFAQTCKLDEITTVRREGVPAQVIPVDGGRIFMFGKKGTAKKSFGFDAEGHLVDFAVKWREQVGNMVTEIARVTQEAKTAANGTALLAATQAALPVFDVCVETLTGTERHPGYDAKLRFSGDLGKLTAQDLRSACQKRRIDLAASLPTLKWRAELERVRDRAVDAYMQVEEAGNHPDATQRVQVSGAALGSYKECVERAEAMAKAPEADKKITVNGPFGPVTAAGLAKACKAEIASAQATLDAALDAQKFQKFLQSCKGDESEVAKREGMPIRIESVGNGRVFTYEPKDKKSKPRRFAFDSNGARVEEAALKR